MTFYGQHDEDRFLAEHFQFKRDGYFIEVGALDGVTFSNTAYFERELGWTGLLIEANPDQAELCRAARPGSTVVASAAVAPEDADKSIEFEVVDGYEALSTRARMGWSKQTIADLQHVSDHPISVRSVRVLTSTLDEILNAAGVSDIDFMSIDIEGYEWDALRGLSLGSRWRPTVVLIERAGMPELGIVRYMTHAGYRYRRSIAGNNDWFELGYSAGQRRAIAHLYLTATLPAFKRKARRTVARSGLLPTARAAKLLLRKIGGNARSRGV